MKSSIVLGVLVVSVGTAAAQPAPAHLYDALPEEPVTRASITLSPIHFILPVVELTGEVRLAPKVGVSAILGAGQASGDTSSGEELTITIFEVGGQFSYYLFRDLRGVHVGIEAIYIHVSDVNLDSSLTGAGLAVGPMIGWKYVHSIGFTFLAQGGVEYMVLSAEDSDTGEMASRKKVIPLLNLNVGWSF